MKAEEKNIPKIKSENNSYNDISQISERNNEFGIDNAFEFRIEEHPSPPLETQEEVEAYLESIGITVTYD